MDISQLAQELLSQGGERVSVAVKVCVNRAPKMHGKMHGKKEEEDEYAEDDDVEDDDEPMPAKGKMMGKMMDKSKSAYDDDDEEDVYVEELSDQYEIDMEGKKPGKR